MAQKVLFSNVNSAQFVQEVKIYYGAFSQTLEAVEQHRQGAHLPKALATIESEAVRSQDWALHRLREKFEGKFGGLDDEAKAATADFFRSIRTQLRDGVFNAVLAAKIFEFGANGKATNENNATGGESTPAAPPA
jgi:hypothetical protein